MKRCQAFVKRGSGCLASRCYKTQSVHAVRWAPTPLTTKNMLLCTAHRGLLERKGDIEVVR